MDGRLVEPAPTLETLVSCLKLNPGDVIAVFLIGSRVYGNLEVDSDWDFIVVVKDDVIADPHVEIANINAGVFNRLKFYEFLHRHVFWILQTHYLPESFVWKKDDDFGFHLKPTRLRKELLRYSKERWESVERWYQKGDIRRAKKNVVHTLRAFLLGTQIVNFQKVIAWDEANCIYYQIMADDLPDWKACNTKYLPMYDEMKESFIKLFPESKMVEKKEPKKKHK